MNNADLKTKWLHNGAPLTMEDELIKFRKDIEQESYPRKQMKVLLKAAYNEMRGRQGKVGRTMDCGSCMTQIMSQLKLWFGLYDKRTGIQKERAAIDIEQTRAAMLKMGKKFQWNVSPVQQSILPKQLPPLKSVAKPTNIENEDDLDDTKIPVTDNKQLMYDQMEWNEILKLMKTLPQESQDKLNAEKTRNFPKKSAIIEELIKYN
jgi:hypothetical protein